MQSNPGAPRPSRFNKWWPIGFFIGAIVCFIIGGALVGTWASKSYDDCSYSSRNSYYSSYYSSYSCVRANSGMFYGGIAMLVIGGVLKLIAWILLIIFCVKRSRSHHIVTYVNSPPAQQPQPHQPYATPQPTYPPAQQMAQFPRSTISPAPGPSQPEMMSPSIATPPPREPEGTATAFKYCGQCGTAVSSRFCPQCGTQS